jgi:hypothetical protein
MIEHFKEGFMKCAEEQEYPPNLKTQLKNTADAAKILGGLGAVFGGSWGVGQGMADVAAADSLGRLLGKKISLKGAPLHIGKSAIKPGLIGAGIGTGLAGLLSAVGYAKMHMDKDKYDKQGNLIKEEK